MRLFTALTLPDEIRSELERISRGVQNVRWVNPHDYHLTLTFHESISHEEYMAFTSILENVHFDSFDLTLNGTGMFPQKKSATLYAAVEESDSLVNLQSDINNVLKSEKIAVDSRRFKPHITLGRVKDYNMSEVEIFLQEGLFMTKHTFSVDHFSLFSSQLTPEGALYSEEERFSSCE